MEQPNQDASFDLSKSTLFDNLTIFHFKGGELISTRTTKIGPILQTKTVLKSGRQTAQ